ncbi:hypothetical protein FRC10_009981 [Ceratobasidium sp. 414]|nr:hypothetical protein FRC10_009981 [Ceratobasidium sp. 414]
MTVTFSACVTAGRLAAANPGLEILLIEQGPENLEDLMVITPALCLGHLAPISKTVICRAGGLKIRDYDPKQFPRANVGRGIQYQLNDVSPSNHVRTIQLTSIINKGTLARPPRTDFDDWNTPGWSAADLIPLLRKTETFHVGPGRETHGYDGPVNISYADHYASVAQEYLDVAAQQGIPLVEDNMDLKTGHGCQTGRRQNAAWSFIYPLANNKSLHVLPKTKVARVLFAGTKATGVEVVANKEQDAHAGQTPRVITARKLVVVSSGAIGSPLVLQRSGIGEAGKLDKVGVETVVDLPSVGATFQDHTIMRLFFYATDDTETFDPLFEQEPGWMEKHIPSFMQGKGMLTSNLIDAGSKLRPTREELKELGPEFNEFWNKEFEPKPDKPLILQAIANGLFGPRDRVPNGVRIFTIGNFTTRSVSRGYMHISSADLYAPPELEFGVFDHKADVDVHIWAYKKAREIARRMPHYRGEYAPLHPKFPESSAAACMKLDSPLQASDISNIECTEADNAAIEAHIREIGETSWHTCASVPMKPKGEGGCVDARLNVYGTQNLNVADLVLALTFPGKIDNSTALLVGEKAAILIAEDLKLKLP